MDGQGKIEGHGRVGVGVGTHSLRNRKAVSKRRGIDRLTNRRTHAKLAPVDISRMHAPTIHTYA